MSAETTSPRAIETTRLARGLARAAVLVLAVLLYNAIAVWGSYILGATPDASPWDAFIAPFWMPVLFTFANPLYAVPLVLFGALYVASTSIWVQTLLSRGRHVVTAAVAAALSMSVGAGLAALTKDETFAWTHGFPILAIARFMVGAALAALIVSSFFPSRRHRTSEDQSPMPEVSRE